jgi:DNA-directed RNA polymerase sigma subunit (sigma70/sigma32)
MKEYLLIMGDGNPLLKKWAKQLLGNRKLRIFREKLFKGEYVPGVDIPQIDYEKIMRVHDIEDDMLHGFAAFVTDRVGIWTSRADDWRITFEDLYQEANFVFLDALYGYLGTCKKAHFITYLWHAIDSHLKRKIDNQKLQLVPPSADGARKLIRSYEDYVQECGRQVTFDEFAIEKKLTDEEINILTKALVKVISVSEFIRFDPDRIGDYTTFDIQGRTIDDFETRLADKDLAQKVKKCIELAKLTNFQKELLEDFCNSGSGKRGGKAKIAKKHGYTRQRAYQVFLETIARIKEECSTIEQE